MWEQLNFSSKKKGTRFLITVAIHGNEPCGVRAVEDLLHEGFWDTIPTKEVEILIGNPKALYQNARFIEVNLNRCLRKEFFEFSDHYEYKRAKIVAEAIDRCDIYLDFHSTSADTPAYALPADNSSSIELALKMPVPYVVKGLVHTTDSQATTIDYANQKNKIAIVFECGKHDSPLAVDRAKKIIKSVLLNEKYEMAKILTSRDNHVVKKDFKFARQFSAFERVNYRELIAHDFEGEVHCPYQEGAYIIMPTNDPIEGEEAWFWGKDDLRI